MNNQEKKMDTEEKNTLLIQGDFFGIQNFIFAMGSETNKHAAKLLRGRSFYVSLMAECAALKVLETLALPEENLLINAAGKFLIRAQNTEANRDNLEEIQQDFNEWFLEKTYGTSGITLAWLEIAEQSLENGFGFIYAKLSQKLNEKRYQRFDLCNEADSIHFKEYLKDCAKKENEEEKRNTICVIDGRSPATEKLPKKRESDEQKWIGKFARDQLTVGDQITKKSRLWILNKTIPHESGKWLNLDIFGYKIYFTDQKTEPSSIPEDQQKNLLLRAWDFSLEAEEKKQLPDPIQHRNLNGYVPTIDSKTLEDAKNGKYSSAPEDEQPEKNHPGDIKSFSLIACDALEKDHERSDAEESFWKGTPALMILKGDVDNLGQLFESADTLEKVQDYSKKLDHFFAAQLPLLCKTEYPETYTVFSGGDDFFLIGSWHQMLQLTQKLHSEFGEYVKQYSDLKHLTFSAGLVMVKPHLPVHHFSRMAEEALHFAKTGKKTGSEEIPEEEKKNHVVCFQQRMRWNDFEILLNESSWFDENREHYGFSSGYLYALLQFVEMAENKKKPENAIWHSYFHYRTYRMLETLKNEAGQRFSEIELKAKLAELAERIADQGIRKQEGAYRIALFPHLYRDRAGAS